MNADAFERTARLFGEEPRFAALVELGRSLARALDESPGSAALAREYRGTIFDLLEAADVDQDEFDDLLADLDAAGSDS